MKLNKSILIKLLTIQCLSALCAARDPDFFYFIQQWPGSFFNSKHSYCYPTGGKPAADFSIGGLWPYYIDGSFPLNCNPQIPYSQSKDLISRMQKSWPSLGAEWEQHGTCSQSVLDQHGYFESALKLKDKIKLLQVYQNAGIKPDGKLYSLDSILEAVRAATGYSPGVKCNADASGQRQLHQIYICVDTSESRIIECPGLPNSECTFAIKFATF